MVLKNFIVFEGIDGSGTTTQLELVKEKFPNILLTAEPTASPVGQFLRRMLSGEFELSLQTAAYLFAADRCEHLWGKHDQSDGSLTAGLVESCDSGKTVISDRYFFSSLAYQGKPSMRDFTARLNESFPLPELLVYFAIPAEVAFERIAPRGDKLEIYEKLSTLKDVARRYDQILADYDCTPKGKGMSVVKVDASLSQEDVAAAIGDVLRPFLDRAPVKTSKYHPPFVRALL